MNLKKDFENIKYKNFSFYINNHLNIRNLSFKGKEIIPSFYFCDNFEAEDKKWLKENNHLNFIENIISKYIFKINKKKTKTNMIITAKAKLKIINILIKIEIFENRILITTKTLSKNNLFFNLYLNMKINNLNEEQITPYNQSDQNFFIHKKFDKKLLLRKNQLEIQSSFEGYNFNGDFLSVRHPKLNSKTKRLYLSRANRLEKNYNTTILLFEIDKNFNFN